MTRLSLFAIAAATIVIGVFRLAAPDVAAARAGAEDTTASRCETLMSLTLPDAKVKQASVVGLGGFSVPNGRGNAAFAALPAFCRVAMTLTPSADSNIAVEVWLPLSGWNGKYEAVGNGGWAGTIGYAALAE